MQSFQEPFKPFSLPHPPFQHEDQHNKGSDHNKVPNMTKLEPHMMH